MKHMGGKLKDVINENVHLIQKHKKVVKHFLSKKEVF
jgi:hypothetical protein